MTLSFHVHGVAICVFFLVRMWCAPLWDGIPGGVSAWVVLLASFAASCTALGALQLGVGGVWSSVWSACTLGTLSLFQRSQWWTRRKNAVCNDDIPMDVFATHFSACMCLMPLILVAMEVSAVMTYGFLLDVGHHTRSFCCIFVFDAIVCCAHAFNEKTLRRFCNASTMPRFFSGAASILRRALLHEKTI
jgi:hypothetical protein